MDLGVVVEGLVGSDSGFFTSPASDLGRKQKLYGSEDQWRSSKALKTEDFSARKGFLKPESIFVSDGQQMLSFSSPKSDALWVDKSSQSLAWPYHHQNGSRDGVCNYGNLSSGSVHGGFNGVRGPFTHSQWMELEHQALIYKFIASNVPVPPNLLIPLRKALDSSGISSFSGGYLRPNSWGLGSFHLGFSNSTDPEPGRCRRTDGKKWRCSRDAVADQKYCERHINRGRHRSRKPVEGQAGHSVAGTPNGANTQRLILCPSAPAVVPRGCTSGSLACENQQLKNFQPVASFASANSPGNRISPFSIKNFQTSSHEESPKTESAQVSAESMLKPSEKSSPLMTIKSFGSSQNLASNGTDSHHSLHQFMENWPKNQLNRSAVSWHAVDLQSEGTQLSISIPVSSSQSGKLGTMQMGLGVGNSRNESNSEQANWVPISWEASIGGPLGEVFHPNTGVMEMKSLSGLNLLTEGWDSSPPVGSSPTGVLPRGSLVSLSNSSAGSSPGAENKTQDGAGLSNDLLGSAAL